MIALVTGANAGIGRATAAGLARRGARVLLVSRDRGRGEAAREEIARETGCDALELYQADLSSQRQVRALAAEVAARHPRLDALVNNAAVYTRRRELSEDGIEMQLAVNHLAPFLLTTLLLPQLRAAAPGRVVTVSSEAHQTASIPWDDLNGERRYGGLRAYAWTKLANLLFTAELARREDPAALTANAAHPGVVGTKLLYSGWAPLRLLGRLLRTPEEGARTSVWLASAPEVRGVSNGYYKDCRAIRRSRAAADPEAARRLWERSAEMTGVQARDGGRSGAGEPGPEREGGAE